MTTYIEQSLAKLKEFEGCVPWMYRDTVGKVTVGVGLMLPDAGSAETLPFLAGTRTATREEIAAEFARVMSLVEGKAAGFYRHAGSLVLAQETMDANLLRVVEGFEGHLRARMGGYDRLPDGVKMALLDMAYNLGPEGLLASYPRLVASIEKGAWAQAAAECVRHGPSVARNTWTREQFLAAVVGTIKAEAEGWLEAVRRWVRGLWGG